MIKKYISCEPYTTFSLSYEQICGDSRNNRQLGTFEFNNLAQTVFSWMKLIHNHSLNPDKSNWSPPHHRTSPQRPRLSVSFFGFTAIWEGSGRIRAALGWEISRWHRPHPLWSRQNIRSSCLRREKAEGWNGGWGVGSSLLQEGTARFTLQQRLKNDPHCWSTMIYWQPMGPCDVAEGWHSLWWKTCSAYKKQHIFVHGKQFLYFPFPYLLRVW